MPGATVGQLSGDGLDHVDTFEPAEPLRGDEVDAQREDGGKNGGREMARRVAVGNGREPSAELEGVTSAEAEQSRGSDPHHPTATLAVVQRPLDRSDQPRRQRREAGETGGALVPE